MGTRMAKISGTLQELSGEELARQQGMEAAPVTPLGAVGVGASADVAKMAGTGEQVRASLRETLKERSRETPVMGEGERARFGVERIQQELGTLEGLGSLDNRIAEQIRANMLKLDQNGIANKVNVAAVRDALSKGGTIQPTDEQVIAAVDELAKLQSTATPEQVVAILSKLGTSVDITANSASLAEKLVPFFDQATKEDITALLEKNAKENAQLTVKALGENFPGNKTNVAEILGVEVTELDEWTLEEVKAGLAAYSSQNFTNVDELREVLASPSATASQKDFARKRLAELGAVGVTSLEEKANNLETQMTEGDTVRFGNEQIPVSDILSNPKYKAVVAGALADPEAMVELEKTDPDLAKWIKANEARLVDIRAEIAKGTESFVTLQKEYTDYVKDVPVDVLDKLSPGWRDAKSIPLADWKNTLPPVLRSTLDDAVPESKAAKMSVISALLPLNANLNTFSAEDLNAIVTEAGNDPAKAADYAKAWYDTSLPEFNTELNPNFKLKYVPPTEDKTLYDDVASNLVEQITGKKQTVDALIEEIKRLSTSKTASDRAKALQMKQDLGLIKDLMNNRLTKVNIEKLKEYKKVTTEKDTFINNKAKELDTTNKQADITFRPLNETLQLHPGLKEELLKTANSFKDAYSGIGNYIRRYVNGEEYLPENQPWNLDYLILEVARRVRGNHKGVSAAKWGSGHLFKYRDELESAARTRAANMRKDLETATTERDQAQSNYSDFITSLRGG